MILEGIEEGIAGRGVMKEDGVLGGSKLGTTFFHDSMKLESCAGVAGTSVEKARVLLDVVAVVVRAKRRDASRNMVRVLFAFLWWRWLGGLGIGEIWAFIGILKLDRIGSLNDH